MKTVSREQAQRLKAQGYPQDNWPQAVWVTASTQYGTRANHIFDGAYYLTYWEYKQPEVLYPNNSWCAAPHPVDALMWQEGVPA